MMIFKRLAAGIALVFALSLVGCKSGGDLPKDPETAKVGAKQALESWIRLLNEGKGEEFLRASLPDAVLADPDVVTANGGFHPEFVQKFYEVLPNLHYALQVALTIDPVIRKGNVVYDFPQMEPVASGGGGELFKERRMYISRTGAKWHFNGPVTKKQQT